MAVTKVYLGDRVDLEFYQNYPIINYFFSVYNDDGTWYSFANSSGVYFKLFAKKGGSLIATIQMGLDSPPTNLIYMNDLNTSPSIVHQRKGRTAWHECYSVEGGQNKLLFEGVSEL